MQKRFQYATAWHVSILVLMEEALRHSPGWNALCRMFRFNPCFNGRGVKTISGLSKVCFLPFVSILVLMEEALRRQSPGSARVPCSGFQSLF